MDGSQISSSHLPVEPGRRDRSLGDHDFVAALTGRIVNMNLAATSGGSLPVVYIGPGHVTAKHWGRVSMDI